MIDEKWLSNVRFTTVESRANLAGVKTARGDFQTGALSKAVNTPDVNAITVRSWLAIANERKSTLVFCVDLVHVDSLTATFRGHGIDARFVTSDTPLKIRAERLKAFKDGEYPVLVNCGIFTEGTDIPNIDCVLLARPTKSRNLLLQMIGRGLRLSPGKHDCHIIDMVASLKKGIVTTPTLFGLDPDAAVTDATAADLKERKEDDNDREARRRASAEMGRVPMSYKGDIAFTHFDNVNSLIESTSGERHIRGISRLAWVQVNDDRYVLSDRSGSYLTLQIRQHDFVVIFTRKIPFPTKEGGSPFMRPVVIAETTTFEHATNAADTFAKSKFVVPMVMASAPWRRMPASSDQIAFLNRFRDEDKQLRPGQINKGSAADWITKLKHGARGRFKRIQAEKIKVEKEREKEDMEIVKAGPVLRGRSLQDALKAQGDHDTYPS